MAGDHVNQTTWSNPWSTRCLEGKTRSHNAEPADPLTGRLSFLSRGSCELTSSEASPGGISRVGRGVLPGGSADLRSPRAGVLTQNPHPPSTGASTSPRETDGQNQLLNIKPALTAWAWPRPPLMQAHGAVATAHRHVTPRPRAHAGTQRRQDPQRPHPPLLSSTPSAQPHFHAVLWRRPLGSARLALGPCQGWRASAGSRCPRALGSLLGGKNLSPASGGTVRAEACFSKSGQWTEQPLEVSGSRKQCPGAGRPLWAQWPLARVAPVSNPGTGQCAARGGGGPGDATERGSRFCSLVTPEA